MIYLYAKAVHIIFVTCWMAGLFYMPRLFIYHREAMDKDPATFSILHNQFILMESRLWWVITTPAMIITILSAAIILYEVPSWLSAPWLHVKFLFVVLMMFYHFGCQAMMNALYSGKFNWSSDQLRLWNEISTVLLFAIVFTVVLKSALNWVYGVVGLVMLGVLLMVLIKLYKKYRSRTKLKNKS